MASVRQGTTVEDDRGESGGAPSALRIDTEVFATLNGRDGEDGDDRPTIVGWFDCWRPDSNN